MSVLAPALCLGVALLAGYHLCRILGCATAPAVLGATAWVLSDALLRPDALAEAGSRGWPGPSLVLPFAVAGAFSRARARWPLLGLTLVCFALRWRSSPAAAPGSYGALEALAIALLAGLGAQRLWDGEGGPAFLYGAAAVAIAGAAAVLRGPEARIAAIELVPVGAAIVLVATLPREARARSGFLALLALLGAERALELGLRARPIVESAESRRQPATAATGR